MRTNIACNVKFMSRCEPTTKYPYLFMHDTIIACKPDIEFNANYEMSNCIFIIMSIVFLIFAPVFQMLRFVWLIAFA